MWNKGGGKKLSKKYFACGFVPIVRCCMSTGMRRTLKKNCVPVGKKLSAH
jgi:hypothetical protein